MDIGVRLRLLRENHGLKQINLANALQVSAQAVSKWERGANLPDIGILLKIAALFNVSTDYLLGVTDAKNGVFEATVLCTGVTHFARRSVVTGSKDLAEYINVLFYHLTESVLKYDGIPVKCLGDGFLAFFSGPDHAGRAIEAAKYAKKVIYQKELVVSLHAGEIYLGLIGHPHYAMRDIVGETVNIAFLLIGWIAKHCDSGIGATETVIRQAGRMHNFRHHPHVAIDLMDGKYVDVYEIV